MGCSEDLSGWLAGLRGVGLDEIGVRERGEMGIAATSRSCRRVEEQFGHADQIIGGHRQGELPIDLGQTAMPQFTQPGHRFGPAECLLDALADALGDAIAGTAGGAAVNGRVAPARCACADGCGRPRSSPTPRDPLKITHTCCAMPRSPKPWPNIAHLEDRKNLLNDSEH
jgi:hypothetical protein